MKLLDDIILQYGDKDLIKSYFDYCDKVNSSPAPGTFIICNEKLANEISRCRF